MGVAVDRVEERGGVGLALALGGEDLLQNTDLNRSLEPNMRHSILAVKAHWTYVEHTERVGEAAVTSAKRPLNLIALKVPLDEWAVRLLEKKAIHFEE